MAHEDLKTPKHELDPASAAPSPQGAWYLESTFRRGSDSRSGRGTAHLLGQRRSTETRVQSAESSSCLVTSTCARLLSLRLCFSTILLARGVRPSRKDLQWA